MIEVETAYGPKLVGDAAANLLVAYEHLAASEALTRALVCERTEKRGKADFWVQVYLNVRESAAVQHEISSHPPLRSSGTGNRDRSIDTAP